MTNNILQILWHSIGNNSINKHFNGTQSTQVFNNNHDCTIVSKNRQVNYISVVFLSNTVYYFQALTA